MSDLSTSQSDNGNLMRQDLTKSGLVPQDINARVIENSERAATLTPNFVTGYAIPYFDIHGKPVPYYRVKLFDYLPKYKAPKEIGNHIYFPKLLTTALQDKQYIIITEGEKKAAKAVKAGFPCVGLAGVDSWRNRLIALPKETALSPGKDGATNAKVPSQSKTALIQDPETPFAVGFQELIDLIIQRNLTAIILFDADPGSAEVKVKASVQRAAANLGFELRFRGIAFARIRQLILPQSESGTEKLGLDDFLTTRPEEFQPLLNSLLKLKSAFPRHPNIRDYINRKLGNSKITRKEMQNVALAILTDLDANGMRLRSESTETYYFDHRARALLKSTFQSNGKDEQFDAPFTQYLYRQFGLSGNDSRLLTWLGTQFTSEEPIEKASPHRILARNDNEIHFQLSDCQYITVTDTTFLVRDNGSHNILFEADQVEPIDLPILIRELESQGSAPLTCWWADTLNDVRLKDRERGRVATALLYYMSPWLHRWRNTQLPVEIITGEAGVGKSTLMELRLEILTGRPHLRNAPQDLKDWHASITNTGGLHVTDNVQLVDRSLRQRLSDELCRIITEPNPCIEQRKYYTNATLLRIPVQCVFAITAIQQPFQNADLLQRAFLLELDKSHQLQEVNGITFDAEWKSQQIKRHGTREAWIAHHLVVLQEFLRRSKSWDYRYKAKYRLTNFEQCMSIMADVFNIPRGWIPGFLMNTTERAISENDWVLEGIKAYTLSLNGAATTTPTRLVLAADISSWAEGEEDFRQCELITNTRKLGRYLKSHKALVQSITGLAENGFANNRQVYKLTTIKPHS